MPLRAAQFPWQCCLRICLAAHREHLGQTAEKQCHSLVAWPIIVITKNDLVDSNTMENLIKLLEEEKIIKNSKYYSINTVTKQGSENLVNDIENIIEDLMITNPKFKTIDNIEIDPEFIQEEEDPFWRDY